MRAGFVVAIVCTAGCSFGIRTQPSALPASEEPVCSESYVRPGFDGTMAVFAAAGAGLAGLHYKGHGCGDVDMYGYEPNPSCSTYQLTIGAASAIAVAFAAAAVYGTTKAGQCERIQDRYANGAPSTTRPIHWAPELVAACEAERSALLAKTQSGQERDELMKDMPCGDVPPPPHRRRRGNSSEGIGNGLLVGAISLLMGVGVFIGNTEN